MDGETAPRRELPNHFDGLRLAFACLVLFSHSYILFDHKPEPIAHFLAYADGGSLAVAGFFFISGYLLYGSLTRNSDPLKFAVSRALRILPGLMVVLLFCIFVVGLAFTTLPAGQYLTDPQTLNFARNVFLFPIHFGLPGVFTDNPFKASVNGSLWTLPLEVFLYGILYLVFQLCRRYDKAAVLVLLLFVGGVIVGDFFFQLSWANRGFRIFGTFAIFNLLGYGAYFFTGSVYWRYARAIPRNRILAAVCLLLMLALAGDKKGTYVELLCLPYLIFYLAQLDWRMPKAFGKFGDISYGVYLYAFPVQQSVFALFGDAMNFYAEMALSLVCAMALGWLSWHFIEKPALQLKNATWVISPPWKRGAEA